MRFVEEISNRRILEGMRKGLFDNLPGRGKPLPDLDQQRNEGWWADRFAAKDKAQLLQEDTRKEIDRRTSAVWRMDSKASVRAALGELQDLISDCNRRTGGLVEPLTSLDEQQLFARWEAVRARSNQRRRTSLY